MKRFAACMAFLRIHLHCTLSKRGNKQEEKDLHLERMDKILASRTQYSRKDAKKLIWQGRVQHNGHRAVSPDAKVDLDADTLELDGKSLPYLYAGQSRLMTENSPCLPASGWDAWRG